MPYPVNPYQPQMKILSVVLTKFPLFYAESTDLATLWCFYIVYPDHCQQPNSVSFDHNGSELFSHEYMIRSKNTSPVYRGSSDIKNIFFVSVRTESGEICRLQEGASYGHYGQFSRDSPATVSKCQTKNHWRHPVRSQLPLLLVS